MQFSLSDGMTMPPLPPQVKKAAGSARTHGVKTGVTKAFSRSHMTKSTQRDIS